MSTSAEPLTGFRALYTDTEGIDCSAGIFALRESGIAVTVLETRDAEEILGQAQDVQALLVGYAPITREMIEQLPELRVIALLSMGFDNVDVEAAREHGIWVTNILGAATKEVATHALALTLFATRGMGVYSANAQAGRWNDRDTVVLPRLSTQTLGLVGFGRIGQHFARIARPIFGDILAFDPFLQGTQAGTALEQELGIQFASLERVQAGSDVLSLHMPLSDETAGFVDAEFLAGMRAGAYLVNVSRGALVDEDALIAAVNSGHLAGAALDVLVTEPADPKSAIMTHPRIFVTPHIGYLSGASEHDYVMMQANNVISFRETGAPNTPVLTLEQPRPFTSLHSSRI